MRMSEKLYHRYEYLAKKYASKIFCYEELSYEFEDLVQEFRMKIYTSIKSYGRRWGKYKRGEAPKPVPLKFYLEAACGNKSRDFMKYISRENNKSRIDDINLDFGIEDDNVISPGENRFIINGIDLLEGLLGKERIVFSLYLRGCSNKIITKVYYNSDTEKKKRNEILKIGDEPLKVSDIIDMQKSYLIRKYGNDLLQNKKVFSTFSFNED